MSTHYFRFTRDTGNRQRAPLLEGLLARAAAPTDVTDWRLDAFRAIAPTMTTMPGAGSAALYADRGCVDAASVFIATPVHYVAEMSNVRLAANGILLLTRQEAECLAMDFNRVWQGAGIRLLAGRCAELFCVFDEALDATTHDPEDVLDRHIDNYLPSGGAAPRLRQLMSEIEMWLFEHAVNQCRIAAAAAAITGLWLWGGGRALTSLPRVAGWVAGEDPLFNALAAQGAVSRGAPAGAYARADARVASDVHGSAVAGVIVIAAAPGTDKWHDAESRWLRCSVADLRSGRITRLDLSSGNRCFSVGARWNWHLWHRRRPWWESFP